jgi:hypothetical protein
MSENPLDPSPEYEQRIRERAYRLWEQEGRPHGRDLEYWERARELEGMASHPDAGLIPNPIETNHGEPPPAQPVEEAEIMRNLGEFPDRSGDQGEHLGTPMTRRQAAEARKEE